MKQNSHSKGISIVEIIVASAIIGISIIGLVAAVTIYLKIVHQNTRETQAVLLLEEAAEALQYIRDVDFENQIQNADPNINYSIFWNGSGYELATNTISLPYNMTRTIQFFDVYRDALDQMDMSNNGTLDTQTRRAQITVGWIYSGVQKSITSELLLHNIYAN